MQMLEDNWRSVAASLTILSGELGGGRPVIIILPIKVPPQATEK